MDTRVLLLPALIAAVLSGCGAEPDFVTRHGVHFRLNGSTFLTQGDAEELEDRYLRDLSGLESFATERTLECVRRTAVDVVPTGNFPCAADAETRCAGEQYGSLLKVAASSCRYDSAYIHELHHWLQECVEGTVDYAHQGPTWRMIETHQAEGVRRCAEEGAAGGVEASSEETLPP